MNLRPVIERELICEARNPANYWLRLVAAAGLLFVGGLYVLEDAASNQAWQGGLLFQRMNLVVLLTIFILVPIITADTIAREKREGTLGLLFLTPLKAREIVIGKCLIHGLRSLAFLFATLPMLCLPLMMGGVSAGQVIHTVAYDLSALCVALAAGIHASVRQVEWRRAVGHALLLSLGLSFLYWTCAVPLRFVWFSTTPFALVLVALCWLVLGALVLWRFVATSAVYLSADWRNLHHPPTPPVIYTLVAQSPYWRRLAFWHPTLLRDNPMALLEGRTLSARMAKWSWLGVVLLALVFGGCLAGPFMDFVSWLNSLLLLLIAVSAFTAAGSFRGFQDGLLEILLVTPLTTRQILAGRLEGIILQSLPAALLVGFFWIVVAVFGLDLPAGTWAACAFHFLTLFTIPLVGLWFGLERLHFLTASLLTLLTGYLVPLGIMFGFRLGWKLNDTISPQIGLMVSIVYQIVLAAICLRQVYRRIDTRAFIAAPI